jgi:rhamnosyltransferase
LSDQIVAVVITYRPELDVFEKSLNALQNQADSVVVVDNGADQRVHDLIRSRGRRQEYVIVLQDNLGVAAAQNIGIQWARERGAQCVVLFDQDSEPAPDMISQLLRAYRQLAEQDYKVAAVGPSFVDERRARTRAFTRLYGFRPIRRRENEGPVAEVDYLISSGCLIPLSTVDAVGNMREELFIDYVDIEWGLRARGHGYRSFGVFAAQMRHSLGGTPIEFLGRHFSSHSALRHYYQFRNATWLYRRPWMPALWKCVDASRMLLKLFFYAIFSKPRLQHIRMMCLGIFHGWQGRMGRFDAV